MTSRYAIAILGALSLAAARAETIDDVLARVDMAARQFQSYSATVKRVDYGKTLDTYDDSSGSMRIKRTKNKVVGIMDTTAGPDHTVDYFDGPIFEIYLPKANTVQKWEFKKYVSTIDQMLLLGFAITRDEIKRDYDAKLVGTETIAGMQVSHILLVPKSAEARQQYVKSIDLWINANGNAVQQKGTEPNGDYRLATFSNLQLNPPLPDSEFELHTPPGTKVVKEN